MKLENISLILSHLKKAILNPQKSLSDNRVFARLLMKPVIFDLYNLIIQIMDFKNIITLEIPKKKNKSSENIAHRHNLLEIKHKMITTSRRVEPAYQIATTPWSETKNLKLLVIGCRNISELKQAKLYGFSWKNIDGLDLFSTNKKIMVSRMEDMKIIDDDTYDVVTMVNTLAYSDQPIEVFKEVYRVLKINGKFVFNFAYHLKTTKVTSKFSKDYFIDYRNFKESDMDEIINKTHFKIYFKYETLKYSVSYKNNLAQPTWYGLIKKNK